MTLGTAQGGILGPLLFTLFLNDMPEFITKGRLFAYADDIIVVVGGSTFMAAAANRALSQFDNWYKRNGL